jgi:hypothetical protein
MILDTMNDFEIFSEIQRDYNLIVNRSIERYEKDYDKIRRHNSIPKDAEFPKCFELRTHAKNDWILILSKAPAENKYKGLDSICYCFLVYYYTKVGIRVFKVDFQYGIAAFNAHFFSRYNERLNLGLINTIDKVKHYFSNNSYAISLVKDNNSAFNVVGKCKDGFRLGCYLENKPWVIYKTFISNSMTSEEQKEIGSELMNSLRQQIESELVKKDFDKDKYDYMADIFKAIIPNKSVA